MSTATIHGATLEEWERRLPVISDLVGLRETEWFSPHTAPTAEAIADVGLTRADIDDAAARLRRFASYFREVFPETGATQGILESPLVGAPKLHAALAERAGRELPGSLWLKLDSELPISGSIKARGGIYEVLQHAERLAIEAGMLSLDDDYARIAGPEFTEFFSRHAIAVGSTGNLGLSIGIISARLGFRVTVHMSADARAWKKDLLRSHGVTVVEYDSDFSEAVRQGRELADADPDCYFVDDENSTSLFLGYAVAARRLTGQLRAFDVAVDEEHPLFVHLPCGVGGGPGGVAFGLRTEFGDHVHPIFAEPTHSPSMLLGVATGLHDGVAVNDFGIDNVTAADGLAVGRPSGFVGKAMQRLIDGYVTVDDDTLYRLLALLDATEGLRAEPSAMAGVVGPERVAAYSEYLERRGITAERFARATHIAWVTGGSMVPDDEMEGYVARGRELLG
ncbi:D-serine ammonia-lyase [Leucobacter ruminantium]|uniref:Probable D-serine dehydratase n=1 Tax=Leucobacter ruminantium TaxID=1289170 RepID=A0A939LUI7_9MICO|nr:D-serine ammonia-lyase [Leucobacter ruminantium]MBO1805064.1 D-serine ammonia-lyase [Leucobacter ruminantium]